MGNNTVTKSSLQERAGARTSKGGGRLAAGVGARQPSRVDDVVVHGASPTETAELRRTLAVTELRFDAALRQIERMRLLNVVRKQEGVVADAAVKAQRFAYHDELA